MAEQQITVIDSVRRGETLFGKSLPAFFEGGAKRFLAKSEHYIKSRIGQRGDITRCNPASVVKSLMDAAQLGLAPDGTLGSAYLVPFGNACQLIIGYRGMIDLARRHGGVKTLEADVVCDGDDFDWSYGTTKFLRHKYGWNRGAVQGCYAIANLGDGNFQFVVLTRDDIEASRRRSKSGDGGPWATDYSAMAMKTAVRKLFKFLPVSPELEQAMRHDDGEEIIDVGEAPVQEPPKQTKASRMAAKIEKPAPEPQPEPQPEPASEGEGQQAAPADKPDAGEQAPATDGPSPAPVTRDGPADTLTSKTKIFVKMIGTKRHEKALVDMDDDDRIAARTAAEAGLAMADEKDAPRFRGILNALDAFEAKQAAQA